MIERFNFYDLYGNLLPGLLLLAIMGVPFAIVVKYYPSEKLSSIVAFVALAYIVGHWLQSMASNVIPSKFEKRNGQLVAPSDVVLKYVLKSGVAERARNNIKSWFGDVTEQDGFNLCRPIVNKASSYPEQFQGLYSMMRGLAVSSALGVAYTLGWAASTFNALYSKTVDVVALFLLGVALIISYLVRSYIPPVPSNTNQKPREQVVDSISLLLIVLILFALGYLIGLSNTPNEAQALTLVGISLIYVAAAERFFVAYRFFCYEFAKTVWTTFAAQPDNRPSVPLA